MGGKLFGLALLALLLFGMQSAFADQPEYAVVITSPVAGDTYVKGQTYTITWTAYGGLSASPRLIEAVSVSTGAKVTIDDRMATLLGGSTNWAVPASLPSGDYRIRVGVQPSSAGIYFDSGIIHVVDPSADTTPPSITGSALVTGNMATITTSATDASGISEIKTYLAIGSSSAHGEYGLVITCSSSPCSYSTALLSGRTYYYYSTAKDASPNYNQATSGEQSFSAPSPGNKAPAISGASGPSSLKAGETGTWTITASDPENGPLSYAIVWGDEGTVMKAATKVSSNYQTATFTHIYYSNGTYSPAFTVTDNGGLTAKTSISVNIGSVPQPTCPMIFPRCNEGEEQYSYYDSSGCLVYACRSTGPTITCTDSDGGKNPFVKGIGKGDYVGGGPVIIGESGSPTDVRPSPYNYSIYYDQCSGSSQLNEAYCENGRLYAVGTSCPSGYTCSNGACVQSTNPTYPTVSTDVSGRKVKGNSDAAITVVEFSDFECPFCKQAQSTLEQISNNYGSRVNFIHMNFPLGFHPNAQKAAEAAECAGDQGEYWDMYERIFESSNIGVSDLKSMASSIGLDTAAFNSCLDSGNKASAVSAQIAEGTRIGVSGTPTFVIGYWSGSYVYGEMVVGAQPYANFKQVLDRVPSVPQPVNKAPAITGVSGPSALKVGETGTWAVKAYDPEQGPLSYAIVWGDEGTVMKAATKVSSNYQTATFTHIYYSNGTYTPSFTVTDNGGLSATTSITVSVGKKETVPGSVDLSIYAEPSAVKLYGSYKVTGKITYVDSNCIANCPGSYPQQRFMVVTSSTPLGLGTLSEASKSAIKLSAKEAKKQVKFDSPKKGWIEKAISAINGEDGSDDDETDGSSGSTGPQQSSGSAPTQSAASVTSVATDSTANSQERTDYITLSPGESTTITAYFTARSPGTKVARIRVYQYDSGARCPGITGGAEAYCKSGWKLVAQDSAKVEVERGETPPSPPSTGSLQLHSGWNMVSVPSSVQVSMAEVASECGTKQYAWRLNSDGYVKDTALYSGYGYWIYSPRECKVALQGSSGSSNGPIDLFSGWNLVPGQDSTVSISSYLGNCQVLSGPWYYSHDSSDTSGRPTYVYFSSLEPGKAYWVKVAQSCRLGVSDDSPPSPPA